MSVMQVEPRNCVGGDEEWMIVECGRCFAYFDVPRPKRRTSGPYRRFCDDCCRTQGSRRRTQR